MKITKVDRTRSAVSRFETDGGRGLLYEAPKTEQREVSMDEKVGKRIDDANRLYSVFFAANKNDGHRDLFTDKSSEDEPRYSMEKIFTELIKQLVRTCDTEAYRNEDRAAVEQSIEKQIQRIQGLTWLNVNKTRVPLEKIQCRAVTWDGLSDSLTRMRKPLKRGTNRQVAVSLIQGLAHVEEKSLSSVIRDYKKDPESYEQLKHFVDSANKDYYKVNVLKSLKHIDVKMQPEVVQLKDGAEQNQILNLSRGGTDKKKGLYDALSGYAASEESADRTLLHIKELLLAYFPIEGNREKFLTKEKLWVFPNDALPIYFDYEFDTPDSSENTLESICKDEEPNAWKEAQAEKRNSGTGKKNSVRKTKEEAEKTAADRRKVSKAKRRIKYVNYGRYLHALDDLEQNLEDMKQKQTHDDPRQKPEESAAFQRYWLNYIKEFVEDHYTGKRILSPRDCLSANMMSACWQDIIRFLCGKYIDIGKAVYHFAMPEDICPVNHAHYGEVRKKYTAGISSFDYEGIKAEETLQRDISTAVMAASSAFSRAVLDETKQTSGEDILMMKEDELTGAMKSDAADHMLCFYGGKSTVGTFSAGIWSEPSMQGEFIKEIQSHLKAVRNENFHYTHREETISQTRFAKLLWENDRNAYADTIRKRYYSNNVAQFYNQEEIKELVQKLYCEERIAEAQIPAFRTLWKRKERADYIDSIAAKLPSGSTLAKELGGGRQKESTVAKGALFVGKSNGGMMAEALFAGIMNGGTRSNSSRGNKKNSGPRANGSSDENNGNSSEIRVIFDGALTFLLKEIYYHDFIVSKDAKTYFYAAVKTYRQENPKNTEYGNAAASFAGYIDKLKNSESDNTSVPLSFGGVCQMILQEYSQQNGKSKEESIYQHFKMIFPICVHNAFTDYVRKNYAFVLSPEYHTLAGEQTYLDEVPVGSKEAPSMGEKGYAWFTLAHLIHPRQLNLLIGDFKSYIQYRQNVYYRSLSAGQMKTKDERKAAEAALKKNVEEAQQVLEVLDFVRGLSGRISGSFEDYYTDAEEYARYLSSFIAFEKKQGTTYFQSLKYFCQHVLPGGGTVDLYADEENPKLLRNVEIARMYAGGNLPLPGRKRVSVDEVRTYYAEKSKTEKILSSGLCSDIKEQKAVLAQQKRKNRLTLCDVTDLYALVSDLLSQLIGLAYLRERDELYLYLGFYYMALRSGNGWQGEELHSAEFKKCSIGDGLVLYQVVSLFEYGLKMPGYRNDADDQPQWYLQGGGLPQKIYLFDRMHKTSFGYVRRMLGDVRPLKNETGREIDKIDQAADLRNYVDHARYYTDHDKSVIQLYSEFYNLFFPYSTRLRNNVPAAFKNTLERYFMECEIGFTREERKGAGLALKDITSTKFTYKLKKEKPCDLDARDEYFLKNTKAVLEYKRNGDDRDETI
ncbi:MAG: type VI-A CRISPR-associated RNA-guided ribonuclease Cas13a [Lachnospiraceae bacterium]|nr:type VI-A CRISPR-associated RNA-guided ribonuclease Cas13a [Lachnospiraceae bacterium]